MGESIDKLFAAINPVGKDMPKPGKAIAQALQQGDSPMDILNIVGMNMDGQQETISIGNNVPLSSEFLPRLPNQGSDNPVPPAGVAPSIKIALDRRVRRKLAWQSPPRAASGQNVEDRLHDLAQIDLPGAPPPSPRRHLPGDQCPLRIGQVACVAQTIALILGTSDFSPWHGALPRIFANPKESQPAEITHCFFGQALRMRSAV